MAKKPGEVIARSKLLRIAGAARVDPGTIVKVLRGERVRGDARDRAREQLLREQIEFPDDGEDE
jgi:hypothetical protein